jgi:glycosyltransferase involved in cell wall biosynthesis
MPDLPLVTHLVDDTTAGGVMRVVDHIRTTPELSRLARHARVAVPRGALRLTRYRSDVIVSHLALSWRTLPALCALRAANPRATLIHVEHSYTEGFAALNVPNQRRFRAMLRTAFALFDRVVAVSAGQGAWMADAGLCPTRKLAVIRSCVDLGAFADLPPADPQPRVLGAIGRLDRQKGFDDLIVAFRAVRTPDIALHIFGEGAEEDRLRALARGDDRIRFCGFSADPLVPFASVDAVVMPSRWEAYGLVAVEALCAGRRLLCAPLDGMTDHAEYGADLLTGGSVEDLRAGIEALVSSAPAPRAEAPGDLAQRLQRDFVAGWADLLRSAGGPARARGLPDSPCACPAA